MLVLNQTQIDLGNLEKNIIKSFEVIVTNEGNTDITPILKRSCGCTEPTLEPKTIKPGKNATLYGRFDTTGKSGFQRKSIYLDYTDDITGEHRSNELSFKAFING